MIDKEYTILKEKQSMKIDKCKHPCVVGVYFLMICRLTFYLFVIYGLIMNFKFKLIQLLEIISLKIYPHLAFFFASIII